MQLHKQETNENSIISVSTNEIKLKHTTLKIPCFVSCSYQAEVDIYDTKAIDKAFLLTQSIHDNIDLLIIGVDKLPKFLPPKQLIAIKQIGISVESMNSKSACLSFNLLLSDLRRVGLLLL